MAESIKTIRVIPFSGKEEDWNRWSKTFLATAVAKGYREVLKPTDPTVKADAELNVQVYNDLILSCQEEVSFGIIDESVSTDFPDGDARLAWKNLKARYEPNTGAAKVQLKQEFHQMKLESADEDPDPWLTALELKRRRLKTLGTTMEDDDMILHILNNLPKEYETVVELCEEDLSRGNINLATVKERIRARYNRLQKTNESMDEAIALMMRSQFKKSCSVCGKIGHKGTDCFTLERNKDKKEAFLKKLEEKRNKGRNKRSNNKRNGNRKNNEEKEKNIAMTTIDDEMILLADDNLKVFHENIWVADSGATTHMTNSLDGMFDLKDADTTISVGDGRKMNTKKIGKWRGTAIDSEGNQKKITLTNVSYVPDLMVNLFSLTAVMEKGVSVIGGKNGIDLKKENWTMKFDTKIGTTKGYIFATTMVPDDDLIQNRVNPVMAYEKAHEILGHPGKNKLIGTAKRLNWSLSARVAHECESCLLGKAMRLRMNKESKNKAKEAGERLMIDISSIKSTTKKRIGKYWLLVVDEATDMKWSFFLKKKSAQVAVLIGFIKGLMAQDKKVKYIRCDNAGENHALKNKMDLEGLNVKFEFTARMTPQQNGKVERAFATLYGRMRAMMTAANFDTKEKHELWMEAASTATKLDNILCEGDEKSPHLKFYGENAGYEKYLRTFGEIGIVTINPGGAIKSKLDDRGMKCMLWVMQLIMLVTYIEC